MNPISKQDLFVSSHSFRHVGDEYKAIDKNALYDSCLPASPKKMFLAQRVGLTGIMNESCVYLDYPPGRGKSRMAIEAIRHLVRGSRGIHKVLVLVMNDAGVEGWKEQFDEYGPELKVSYLSSRIRSERHQQVMEFSGNVLVVTYPSLLSIMCSLPIGGKTRKHRQVDMQKAVGFSALFDMVVFDEAREIGNPSALRFQLCSILSRNKKKRVCMSATPFSRDPAPLWSQGFVLDEGKTFGNNFFAFRSIFYRRINVRWGNGIDYQYNHRFNPHLNRLFSNLAISYNPDECDIDMPEVTSAVLPIPQSEDVKQYSRLVASGIRAIHKSGYDKALIENVYMTQRRLASAFIRDVENGIGGQFVPVDVDFSDSPKMDTLIPLIQDCIRTGKMIIYVHFIHSGQRIAQQLKKLGIEYAEMYGDSHKNQEYVRFRDVPDVKVMIAHPKSGGVGLNLQFAPYMVFYEIPDSPDVYYQALHRSIRAGSSNHVFVWHFLTTGSCEPKIWKWLQAGKDAWHEILNHPKEFLEGISSD